MDLKNFENWFNNFIENKVRHRKAHAKFAKIENFFGMLIMILIIPCLFYYGILEKDKIKIEAGIISLLIFISMAWLIFKGEQACKQIRDESKDENEASNKIYRAGFDDYSIFFTLGCFTIGLIAGAITGSQIIIIVTTITLIVIYRVIDHYYVKSKGNKKLK